jgi:hypothetical protein
MALNLYDNVFPYINGAQLTEAMQVQASLSSDDQSVMTIAKGFAGISPSPDIRECTIEQAVPVSDFDVGRLEEYKLNRTIVTLGLQFGGSGQRVETNGFIMSVSIDAGVGKTTTLSLTFRGEPKKFS